MITDKFHKITLTSEEEIRLQCQKNISVLKGMGVEVIVIVFNQLSAAEILAPEINSIPNLPVRHSAHF